MPEDEAPPVQVRRLGRVPYRQGLTLQEARVRERREGKIPDQLLLLEHPHVITLGSSAQEDHLLLTPQELTARGVELCQAGRGGDVTYHGPGQLVGYPILALRTHEKDLHRYLRDLEEVLIRTLAAFHVQAGREEGFTGVWVPEGKLAAIGVRVSSGWITSHGFALNVDPDLSRFSAIVPCGIQERPVTSLSRVLERQVSQEEVIPRVVQAFGEVFRRTVVVV